MGVTDIGHMAVGLVIGWRSLCVLNNMTPLTSHVIRGLHLVLAVSVAGVVLAPLYDSESREVFNLLALATFLLLHMLDRRRK